MRFHRSFAWVLVAAGLVACNAITGVDDYQFGGGGPTSTGTAGGEPACDPLTQKECNESCVELVDPTHGCDGASCEPCPTESMCCAERVGCTDVGSDPTRCGSCTNACAASEWCDAAMCTCRPGLTGSAGSCIDPNADPAACGGGNPCVAGAPLCEQGGCVASCSAALTECAGGCVDTTTHPLHCGACDKVCEVDEICVAGGCVQYVGAGGCATCPCAACSGDFDMCCVYPGTAAPICLSHDAPGCP